MREQGEGARGRIGALAAGLAAGVTVLAWTACCPVADAAQIAAGGSSACMIAAGGHVECWGANESGQLGNGTTVRSATPVEVQDVTGARDIGVGEGHSCAVLSTGHVECWGSNGDGALGNGGHGSYSQVPVEVNGIADAVQIAVGLNHTCVVLSSGRVDCWGAKVIEAIDSPSYTPVEVPGIHDATEAAVGGSHSCALLSTGHVECWEEDFYGQLGDGRTRESSETPVEALGVTSARQIAAGGDHTCALLSGGQVDCWGDNQDGDLGDGGTELSDMARPVRGVVSATGLAAGGNDTCAVTSAGRVACWGNNYYGQFDDGGIRSSDTPVDAHDLAHVAQIAVEGAFSCALFAGGSAACWGDDDFGQLGYGTYGGDRDTPIAVHGLSDAVQVAVGWPHACSVRSDGHLDCWGENVFGELGDGTTERKEAPVPVLGLTQVVQASAGESDSCAVLATGRVECWGGGSFEVGQLGNATNGSSTTPVEVKNITTATQVATETYGSCALLLDGHVDCWGSGGGGALGNGTLNNPSNVPVEVHGITDAVQIAAGEEHFCAVLATGHIDCWGGNRDGQLGDGSDRLSDVPVRVQGIVDAAEVAGGYAHSCARLSSGHVDCWGDNANGQLGDGTTIGPQRCPETSDACSRTPLEVPSLSGVVRIAAGGNDSCAVLSSGHAACWGGGDAGQIGDGTFGPNGCELFRCDHDEPTAVSGLTTALAIAVGGNNYYDSRGTACAIVSGGSVECWGSNSGGVLGDDLAWSTTPVTVAGSPAPEMPGEPAGAGKPSTPATEQPSLLPGPETAAGASALGGLGTPRGESSRAAPLSFSAGAAAKARVALRLACDDTVRCRGTVSITVERPRVRHRPRRVSLAGARFECAAGSRERLILHLNPYARGLLAKGETLHTTVTIAVIGSSALRYSAPLTIHPANR